MSRERASVIERTHLLTPDTTIRYCGYCKQPMYRHPGRSNKSCRPVEVQEYATDRGQMEVTDIPVRVSGPKRLSGQMVAYMDRDEEYITPPRLDNTDPYTRASMRLLEQHPEWADVYFRHKQDGQSYKKIAEELGITYENARARGSLGKRRFAEMYQAFGGNPDEI